MAILDSVDLSGIGNLFGTGAIIVVSIVIFGGFTACWVYLYLQWKKYNQFKVEIFQNDSFGHQVAITDSAGIFKDAMGQQRFWLKRAGVGLDTANIKYYLKNGKKTVELLKVSDKSYKVLCRHLDQGMMSCTVSSEDTNWAKDEYQMTKRAFLTDMFEKYAPLIGVIACSMIICVMIIYCLKEMGGISKNLMEVASVCKGSGALL